MEHVVLVRLQESYDKNGVMGHRVLIEYSGLEAVQMGETKPSRGVISRRVVVRKMEGRGVW